ncbi:MAG: D-alanyl-D-alanine carboxypeptidase [Candidatus Levybacteria bacterium]|nr:D-alanyl-D-alanine carboxypeptidase [Candidatus Levybacteria bacterium]
MDDILTVLDNNISGVKVGFQKGEKIRFEDLLYAMLLPSGNDAALTIAQNYPGGVEAFVEKMNEKAKDLYLLGTHFSDPAGLQDDGDYTTALDLGRLASVAMRNEKFSQIVSTKYKAISSIDGSRSYELRNLNKLLGTNGVTGIKTGFTDEAGGVLVTSTYQNGKKILIVIMKSQDRFADTNELLLAIEGNLTFLSIRP